MAKVTAKVVRQLTLVLTEPEAKWLRDMLQNPILPNETKQDRTYREELFKGLAQALKDNGQEHC